MSNQDEYVEQEYIVYEPDGTVNSVWMNYKAMREYLDKQSPDWYYAERYT